MVDDLLIFASLVFGIAQGIAISLAVAAGYGYHYTTVSSANLDRVMKVRISQLPRDLLPPLLFHALGIEADLLVDRASTRRLFSTS
jgi:hypothetical protein